MKTQKRRTLACEDDVHKLLKSRANRLGITLQRLLRHYSQARISDIELMGLGGNQPNESG